jgi:putative endonuclease
LGGQAHRRGHSAEWWAAAWLLLKGYQILGFRLKAAGAEIDILARKGRVLALVEVKQRPSFDAALEALGPDQRQRLLNAGQALVQGRRSLQGLDLRLDVMAVVPGRWPRHYRNLDAG